MGQFITQYGTFIGGLAVGIGAITAFALALRRIKQIAVSVEDLTAKLEKTTHGPTLKEIERYGKQIQAMNAQLKSVTEAYETNASVMNRITASAERHAEIQKKIADSMAAQNEKMKYLNKQIQHLVDETYDLLGHMKQDQVVLRRISNGA